MTEVKETKEEGLKLLAYTCQTGSAAERKFQRNRAALPPGTSVARIDAGHPLEKLSRYLSTDLPCVACDKKATNHMSAMKQTGAGVVVYILPTCDESKCREAAGSAAYESAATHTKDDDELKMKCAVCEIEGDAVICSPTCKKNATKTE
ncbi:MAG: hypothetical protein KGL39_01050 [Patescibacteria group bacterium]|nr:hypothetical protein [Patescibacteria group bacterium]